MHHASYARIALLGLAIVWAGCVDTRSDRSIVGSEDPVRQPAAKGAVNAAPGRYIVALEDGVSASEAGPRAAEPLRVTTRRQNMYTPALCVIFRSMDFRGLRPLN